MPKKDDPYKESQLIRKDQLSRILSISDSTIDRRVRSDPDFPQPRVLGPGTLRWVKKEVVAYINGLKCAEYEDHAFDPNA